MAAGRRALLADVALLALATLWGATFPLGKAILRELPPFHYLAARFAVAALALLPFALAGLRRLPVPVRLGVLRVGLALAGGFALQTLGLRTAGPTVAAFLTALSVPLVAVFGAFVGRRPTATEWLGVALASAGLALLTFQGTAPPGAGELLLVGCAVAFAWHILWLDRVANAATPAQLGLGQCLVTAIACGALLPSDPAPAALSPFTLVAVAGMALFASAAAFSIMAWAQRHTHPTHVGLCFAFEPVAAAVFSHVWMGERLSGRQWAGAALILAGIVAAEAGPPHGKNTRSTSQ